MDGGIRQESPIFKAWEHLTYNHRRYFIAGLLTLFFSFILLTNVLAPLCFLTLFLSIYFFARGFALRNVLLLYLKQGEKNQITGLRAPKKAIVVNGGKETGTENKIGREEGLTDAEGHAERREMDVWEIDEPEYVENRVPGSGITLSGKTPLYISIMGIEIERYQVILISALALMFLSVVGARLAGGSFCLPGLIGFLLLFPAFVEKRRNGLDIFPVYLEMTDRGYVFEPLLEKVVRADEFFRAHLMTGNESTLSVDAQILHNYRPHSLILTTRNIFLDVRKGLIAGSNFLRIPLLSLKKIKVKHEWINRAMAYSILGTLFWAIFFPYMAILILFQLPLAFLRRGKQIQGRALNLNFVLMRKKNKEEIEQTMEEMDEAYHKRINNMDAEEELSGIEPFEKLPPVAGLTELKKGVRQASTSIILPIFFFSFMKLMKIFDVDISGLLFVVVLLAAFALFKVFKTVFDAYNYQRYLKRPEKGTIKLGKTEISIPELIIVTGYLILSIGILRAVQKDLLTLAYVPGITGGILIIAGRFTFNSKFMGIDYQDKRRFLPEEKLNPWERIKLKHGTKLTPVISFVLLLLLMAASLPYFGHVRAEVPEEYLDAGTGNNWKHLTDHDNDTVGLMGMFGLSIRIYEDDASDGNGYPAFLSVVTLKFPATPDTEKMLKEMRKYLWQYSEDERVVLEEPPIEGEKRNNQGYIYRYFIYNGTAQNGTTMFSVGRETRIICAAYKADDKRAIVIAVGIAQVSMGRLIDVNPPPPLPQPPNPTDTRDFKNWNELKDELIPNIRV